MVFDGVGDVEFFASILACEIIKPKVVGEVEVCHATAELGGVNVGVIAEADDGEVLVGEAVEVGAETEHAACVMYDA